jgi:hypothetical protein
MSTETNLKLKNSASLWVFFICNCFAFALLFLSENLHAIQNDFMSMISFRTSGVLLVPVVLFIINGLLSSNQKAALVFWRYENCLPGCRAFTIHAKKDPRINLQRLKSLHGTLPKNPRDQNQLWYKIYKKHSSDIVIAKSHKDFLLARDMTAISFLFIIFAGLPMIFLGKAPYNYWYMICLSAEYLVLAIVAQNHGKRFVTNVLAMESTK